MSSKSSRKDGNDPKSNLVPRAVRGKIKLIAPKTSKFKWYGYEAFPETSPLPSPSDGFMDRLTVELKKFQNPPKTEVELAEPAAAGAQERAR